MSVSPRHVRGLHTGDPILSERIKDGGRLLLAPVVRLAARLKITPNEVTVAGFVIVLGAAVLVADGRLLAGAAVLVAGSLLDAIDGALARATGVSNAFGNFLDSTLDRAAEAILYGGIVAYQLRAAVDPVGPVLLALAALAGSFMVSYTRAKAEGIGLTASIGLAPRMERLALIVLGIGLAGIGFDAGLIGAMALVAILATLTTIQRIWHVRRQVEAQELPTMGAKSSREN